MAEFEDVDTLVTEGMDTQEGPGANILQDKEQIDAYIKMLQEQMAKTAAVEAPLMSIPSYIFVIAFLLFFSAIGNSSDAAAAIKRFECTSFFWIWNFFIWLINFFFYFQVGSATN